MITNKYEGRQIIGRYNTNSDRVVDNVYQLGSNISSESAPYYYEGEYFLISEYGEPILYDLLYPLAVI